MKRKHYYLSGILALLLFALVCLYQRELPGEVRKGYTSAEIIEDWDEVIASRINTKGISMVVDGKSVDFPEGQPYMTEERELMIPVSVLKEYFCCRAGIYDENTIRILGNDCCIEAELNSSNVWLNQETLAFSRPFEYTDGDYYVNAGVIAQGLEYNVQWDVRSGILRFSDQHAGVSKLPVAFDPRNYDTDLEVMNQGKLGTCWAFASVGALEAALLPEEHWRFSVDHMSLNNGYSWTQDTGGEYTMAMAYLLSWKGPVNEADDPYGDGVTDTALKAVKHVQDIQIIQAKDLNAIKKAVFLYGSVQTSMYCEVSSDNIASDFYNPATSAYCYIGTDKINHDTLIVGWDDAYPAENFNTPPGGNGAYLCLNSWGKNFGDGGYFWVSYYDSNIGIYNVAYTGIEPSDNYDSIYQSDICGWVGQLGYGKEEAYFANFFTAEKNEAIEAVGFYATGPETVYEVYAVNNAHSSGDLSFRNKVASGTLPSSGYYTIKLDKSVPVAKGEEFALIVYVRTPGGSRPIAVEYSSDDGAVTADLSDGKGFISLKGTLWQSAEEKYNCNLCLKAYTRGK